MKIKEWAKAYKKATNPKKIPLHLVLFGSQEDVFAYFDKRLKEELNTKRNESLHSSPQINLLMKTPMQELIETFEEMRSPVDSKVDVDFAISLMKSMLEKEKEVMESAWQDGMYECDGDGTFEDFYKTFNTKDVK